jgi:hypothetical protein
VKVGKEYIGDLLIVSDEISLGSSLSRPKDLIKVGELDFPARPLRPHLTQSFENVASWWIFGGTGSDFPPV